MPTLSVISVTYNEARHVARLRQALRALDNPAGVRIEAILVDGGSADGTAAAARAAGFEQVIELPGASIPVCRNRGLQAATGEWIAFLDGDCEPASDWLERVRPLLERDEAVMLGWPAEPPSPMTWVQSAWLFHWRQKNPRVKDYHGVPAVRSEGFRMVTTRNLVLHRRVLDRIGSFNEELATGEDTDFAFRAYQAGVPVLGLPGLHVTHHGEPATLAAFFRQQLWHANRRSYEHIQRLSGGKVGGNAPRFTRLYLATALLALAGLAVAAAAAVPYAWGLMLVLPWLAVVAGPAALLSLRGRTLRPLPALCVLYAAYGLARSLDLLGFHPRKPSWKAPALPRPASGGSP